MLPYVIDKSQCAHHEIFPGVHIWTTHGEHVMISLVEMAPGAVVQRHSHPHEQLGILLEGEAEFTIGDQRSRVVPGQMWRIPGGVEHMVVAGPQGAKALDVFYPIRQEYT